MEEYKPNEIIADRACELWVRMLSQPKFDALGKNGHRDDPNGSMFMAQVLATGLAEQVKAPVGVLEAFRLSLKKYLTQKIRWEDGGLIFDETGYYETRMNVDYHPDCILRQAAQEAGIDEGLFPWKTNMNIDRESVCVSCGYGTEYLYHYPIEDGKWLITTLRGSDIDKVIAYIKGEKPEFTIEG